MIDKSLTKKTKEVLKRCGKTEKDVDDAYNLLKEWAPKHPHLSHIPIDELISFQKLAYGLVNCKFNMEMFKNAIDSHYSLRNTIPEVFSNWDPFSLELQRTYKWGCFLILPDLTPDLNKIVILRLLDPNPDKFDIWEGLKMAVLFSETHGRRECAFGEHYIIDMTNVKFSHCTKITPTFIKKARDVIANGYALRLFGVHILNATPHLGSVLNTVKPFLKQKIFGRIYVHQNLASLHKVLPEKLLPKEYGGVLPSIHKLYDNQIKQLESMRDVLMKEIQYKSDESKRVTHVPNEEIYTALHGTFKKLTID